MTSAVPIDTNTTDDDAAHGGIRIVARLLDVVVWFPAAAAIQAVSPFRQQIEEFVLTVLLVSYEVVLTAIFGATLGKVFTHLRVVRAGTRQPIGIRRSAVRWSGLFGLSLILSLLPPEPGDANVITSAVGITWPLIIFASIILNDRRQGLHDRLAGTIVIDLRRRRDVSATISSDPRGVDAV